ncbi:hypothetical protein ACFROC_26610 [Nocardia tengchongensis]
MEIAVLVREATAWPLLLDIDEDPTSVFGVVNGRDVPLSGIKAYSGR